MGGPLQEKSIRRANSSDNTSGTKFSEQWMKDLNEKEFKPVMEFLKEDRED